MGKKNIKAILFDLDGTLLPMKQENFVKAYFGTLAKKLAPNGYDAEKLIASVWAGTESMIKNDGSKTNEQAFWNTFAEIHGESARADEKFFEAYYKTDFDKVQDICGFNPKAKETVEQLKKLGYRLVLATNPIFPRIATEKRIRWAGLNPGDFEIYTTYENSVYCKPNLKYFKNICEVLQLLPEECLMVGNDVEDDMPAQNLGMHVFLLTDCLINSEGKDLSSFPQGNFDDLIEFVKNQ